MDFADIDTLLNVLAIISTLSGIIVTVVSLFVTVLLHLFSGNKK